MTFCITLADKGKFIEDETFYIPFTFDEYSGQFMLKIYLQTHLIPLCTIWIKVLRANKKKYLIV